MRGGRGGSGAALRAPLPVSLSRYATLTGAERLHLLRGHNLDAILRAEAEDGMHTRRGEGEREGQRRGEHAAWGASLREIDELAEAPSFLFLTCVSMSLRASIIVSGL